MNTNEIVARLQKGESIDDIAKELTETLNAAKREYDAAEQKRRVELAKRADADQICTLLNKFIAKYYPEVDDTRDIHGSELIEIVDLFAAAFKEEKILIKKLAPEVESKETDFNDAIEDFLNKFVR